MGRSGDLLDAKVYEADFFLEKLRSAGTDFFAARCYFSAFVSAARSITFAMQAVMHDIPGFSEWYSAQQAGLGRDCTARFFLQARNESQKIGLTPVNSGSMRWRPDGKHEVTYRFAGGFEGDPSLVPEEDVVSACHAYLTRLVQVVFDAYVEFDVLSPQSFFSVDKLKNTNLTIEDIEEALGYPRGYTAAHGLDDESRLELLKRNTRDTAIDRVFQRYLGRSRQPAT